MKRANPLSRLPVAKQAEIYQAFADGIPDLEVAEQLAGAGLNLTLAEVGVERTIWRDSANELGQQITKAIGHWAAGGDGAKQYLIRVAGDNQAAAAATLSIALRKELEEMLDAGEEPMKVVALGAEALNELSRATYQISRTIGNVATISSELSPPEKPDQKKGITQELINDIFGMLRLMPEPELESSKQG